MCTVRVSGAMEVLVSSLIHTSFNIFNSSQSDDVRSRPPFS